MASLQQGKADHLNPLTDLNKYHFKKDTTRYSSSYGAVGSSKHFLGNTLPNFLIQISSPRLIMCLNCYLVIADRLLEKLQE